MHACMHAYIHTYFIYLYTVKSSVKKNNLNNTVLQDCRVGARLTIAVKQEDARLWEEKINKILKGDSHLLVSLNTLYVSNPSP